MAHTMQDIIEVWDTGDTSRGLSQGPSSSLKEIIEFTNRTGASAIRQLNWKNEGRKVSCPYPATILPDYSGVILADEWHFQGEPQNGAPPWPKHLRVLNADGSLRFRLYAPVIDEHSVPSESWIEEPRDFSERGVPFGSPACDGYRDMVLDIDWQTGELKRWIDATPWLRR